MAQVKINLRFYYQRTWGRYGTSGSLTTASKLISAIPSVCPFSKLGCSDISSALSPFRMSHRFLLSTSENLLVFYEMLELEVTYSRSRIVSTSRGAVLKRKKKQWRERERERQEKRKEKEKQARALTSPSFAKAAFQCTFTPYLLLISTMRIIQPEFPASFFIPFSLSFFSRLLSCSLSCLYTLFTRERFDSTYRPL